MKIIPTALQGAYLIEPEPIRDSRGWFSRIFDKKDFEAIGSVTEWVQANNSFTTKKGTVRGLHYQHPPYTEYKLVRCIQGLVYDVIVDVRAGSSTFLNHFAIELSAENRIQLLIPAGFAHGFQTMTDDCELLYWHSSYYTPGAEGAVRFNDPALDVSWPLPVSEISDRDAGHPLIAPNFPGINLT